jgi:hypothetical protein
MKNLLIIVAVQWLNLVIFAWFSWEKGTAKEEKAGKI